MSAHRMVRVAEEIKRELSQMIREELKDPRVKGLISITHVDVTNDFKIAKIYVSQLTKDPEQAKATLLGLEKAGGYLRSELAGRLRLRFTPELVFKMDQSIEYGAKINTILSSLGKKESEPKNEREEK